jgi:mRNA-degrading endonuclease toxin of MazEF toxin-antitoxin module
MVDRRGEVWWGPAPYKSSPSYRPWLIVSDDSPPFADEEAIVLALTTRAHDAGIAVPDDAWVRGGSDTDAFLSP